MSTIKVLNMAGAEVGTVELCDSIFGIEPNQAVVHEVVKNHLANCRQGTQSALTRAEVSGGGRKPWRQKGTGHARQGSTRAPQWTHGGIVFAPKPRSYSYVLNKKVKRLAMKSALSAKAAAGEIVVIDSINGGQEPGQPRRVLRHAFRHARLAGVFCQTIFRAYAGGQRGFRRKAAEFQDRKLRNFAARGAFARCFERENVKCFQRFRRGLPRERRSVGRRVVRPLFRRRRVGQSRLNGPELLFYALEPFLPPQRGLKRRLLLRGLLQNGGAQILQQIAGRAAAGDPAVPAEARQKKFVGILDKARLFPQNRSRLRICLRAVPAGAEGLAEPDIPFQHPCRAAARKRVNARIRVRKRFIQRLRLRLRQRGHFRLHGWVGQNIRQQLRRGKLRRGRHGSCGSRLRLLLFRPLRPRAHNDGGKPARRQDPGCDQAVLRGGKAQQDQQKSNDNALDGTHGISSFAIYTERCGNFSRQ